LNNQQKLVYDIVDANLTSISPLRMIIAGTAGTGKSFLIDNLISLIKEKGYNVKVGAFTGVAANNIQGETINSLLSIPVSTIRPLEGNKLATLQEKWKDVKYLILDEMSMISTKMLGIINERLKQAFPEKSSEPFGNLSILMLGDFGQIPPVIGHPLYSSSSNNTDGYVTLGRLGYQTFHHAIFLDEVMRQSPDQIIFRNLLLRVRDGESTERDWEILNQRALPNLSQEERIKFTSSPRLYSKKADVDEYNFEKLRCNNNRIVKCKALHSHNRAEKCPAEDAQGLEAEIVIAEGARIMLTSNLCLKFGLVNGALGSIKKIVYSSNQSPPALPSFVLVQFDGYSGPTFQGAIPIPPISRTWFKDGLQLTRTQLPLKLSFAITIHKSQGLTLPIAVVNFGDKEFTPGLTFVSLSRTKKIEDLALEHPIDFVRLKSLSTPRLQDRKVEDERIKRMAEETKKKFLESNLL